MRLPRQSPMGRPRQPNTSMTSSDDCRKQLLAEARGGDDDALGELIEHFRPMLRADAARSLGEVQGRIDASDVVQLTWWSAFRAFPKFEGDVTAFIGWLKHIHDRNLRDVLRAQHAGRRNIRFEVSAGAAVLSESPGQTSSPSQKMIRAEQRDHLSHCLSRLPPAQRQVLQLRFQEGLTVSEIVQKMGRSETAIAGLLKRGLSGIRAMINHEQV
ncbi:MAG: sigma-70 family RNA polymerase sigma factor [Planctomycetaceae bacterium]